MRRDGFATQSTTSWPFNRPPVQAGIITLDHFLFPIGSMLLGFILKQPTDAMCAMTVPFFSTCEISLTAGRNSSMELSGEVKRSEERGVLVLQKQ